MYLCWRLGRASHYAICVAVVFLSLLFVRFCWAAQGRQAVLAPSGLVVVPSSMLVAASYFSPCLSTLARSPCWVEPDWTYFSTDRAACGHASASHPPAEWPGVVSARVRPHGGTLLAW